MKLRKKIPKILEQITHWFAHSVSELESSLGHWARDSLEARTFGGFVLGACLGAMPGLTSCQRKTIVQTQNQTISWQNREFSPYDKFDPPFTSTESRALENEMFCKNLFHTWQISDHLTNFSQKDVQFLTLIWHNVPR